MTTEAVYRGLTGETQRAPHRLAASDDLVAVDRALVAAMDRVRDVCCARCRLRKATGRGCACRWPSLTVAAPDAEPLAPFVDLIADEVNVKEVVLTDDLAAVGAFELQVVPGVARPTPRQATCSR